jgi:ABC-2 type transport system permease protein
MGLDLSRTDMSALGLTILITTFSTCGLGLLMGCLSLITANVMFVNNFVYFSLLVFSGANVEVSALPAWMQVVSNILPLTRGIASARALAAGASLSEVAPMLISEVGIGIVYGLIGYFLFAWFETQAKQKGTLETV